MDYKNHLVFGFIGASIFLILNITYHLIDFSNFKNIITTSQFEPYFLFYIIILFFSVLADIDSEQSKIHRLITLILIVATIYFIIIEDKKLGLIASFSLLGLKTIATNYKWHRTFLHKTNIIILVSIFLYFIGGMFLFFASLLGMAIHNLTDWVNSKFWREV